MMERHHHEYECVECGDVIFDIMECKPSECFDCAHGGGGDVRCDECFRVLIDHMRRVGQ